MFANDSESYATQLLNNVVNSKFLFVLENLG